MRREERVSVLEGSRLGEGVGSLKRGVRKEESASGGWDYFKEGGEGCVCE